MPKTSGIANHIRPLIKKNMGRAQVTLFIQAFIGSSLLRLFIRRFITSSPLYGILVKLPLVIFFTFPHGFLAAVTTPKSNTVCQ
jgi:hypothetical protein